ncbi:MAG: M23 family metallopeptidase [Treponemataceae bacterium]|nr:M23 family metallopeptidase [Treponemataceae bacterium]
MSGQLPTKTAARRRTLQVLSAALLCARPLPAEDAPLLLDAARLPVIEALSHNDLICRQLRETIRYNDAHAEDPQAAVIEFYAYTPKRDEDLLSVAAASEIPYDTIATLNGLPGVSARIAGRTLLLPSAKGIFLPERPESAVELLLAKENADFMEKSDGLCYTVNARNMYFIPGRRFSPTARAFFLDSSLRMPLDSARISSAFGYRQSPVYGTWKFHKGIDLAAPAGDNVYACQNGTVSTCVRGDAVFGNYIILSHENGMTSVYAHLSEIAVQNGQSVSKGAVIGTVGQTGAATGPHLHFEIRRNGEALNPGEHLPLR